jgi:hypothetical protein
VTSGALTSEGERLVRAWLDAKKGVEHAESQLNSAECALANAHDALAKWLAPGDMKVGEKIAVWHGDSLIQVEKAEKYAGTDVETGIDHTRAELTVTVRSRSKRGF